MRSRDIGTVVPRNGEATTGFAGALVATDPELCDAEGVGVLIAASTSSFLIRPPIPVPRTLARLTPLSDANFLTIGVTYASAFAAGALTTGFG